ncbi:MAG: hypothetical protein DIZ80_03925 [endosymbiont of Galathealinum brachiosum]|uniref:ABC-type transport auxiliary lipoprotein component domain-containing protein n=1 Tax=endosymbiont of Galathealinum brachiosum TaxID=2200906 RepID=A0A370DKE8_9GAMM|nr:MAG: hypothetical protein DIZ80_03925 [endosymbiont of Galathealinum brachiosum]
MFRLILLLLLVSSIWSCSLGGGPAPTDHFYRLPEVALDSQVASYKSIVVKAVKSTGLYHERAILFIESDKPLELQRYHYSFWSTTPAELVHNALYQGVVSSGIADQVNRDLTENRPDFVLDTRIIHFERIINGQTVNIEIELEVSVKSGSLTGDTWTKRYKVNEALQNTDMHSTAEAFGAALTAISNELIEDLLSKK